METFDPSSASFLNFLHLRIRLLIPYEDGPDKNMLGQSRIPKNPQNQDWPKEIFL